MPAWESTLVDYFISAYFWIIPPEYKCELSRCQSINMDYPSRIPSNKRGLYHLGVLVINMDYLCVLDSIYRKWIIPRSRCLCIINVNYLARIPSNKPGLYYVACLSPKRGLDVSDSKKCEWHHPAVHAHKHGLLRVNEEMCVLPNGVLRPHYVAGHF